MGFRRRAKERRLGRFFSLLRKMGGPGVIRAETGRKRILVLVPEGFSLSEEEEKAVRKWNSGKRVSGDELVRVRSVKGRIERWEKGRTREKAFREKIALPEGFEVSEEELRAVEAWNLGDRLSAGEYRIIGRLRRRLEKYSPPEPETSLGAYHALIEKLGGPGRIMAREEEYKYSKLARPRELLIVPEDTPLSERELKLVERYNRGEKLTPAEQTVIVNIKKRIERRKKAS